MLKDTDFEFPKRDSKLDKMWVEWNNLTNDKEKRRYCNELEEVIKDLEDELDSKNKEVEKLINSRKQLVGYLAVSIIILLFGVCGILVFLYTQVFKDQDAHKDHLEGDDPKWFFEQMADMEFNFQGQWVAGIEIESSIGQILN